MEYPEITPKDPPPEYGPNDRNVIFEEVGSSTWVWHAKNAEAYIFYDGPTVSVEE